MRQIQNNSRVLVDKGRYFGRKSIYYFIYLNWKDLKFLRQRMSKLPLTSNSQKPVSPNIADFLNIDKFIKFLYFLSTFQTIFLSRLSSYGKLIHLRKTLHFYNQARAIQRNSHGGKK